jgi:outer membrane protein assembly factor BamD (BamD/ComL family)
VIRFVEQHFVPLKIHIREQPRLFERFEARWTPTQLILDENGEERYRIEGFLPKDDLLAQLEMGLGKLAFERKRFEDAERQFHDVEVQHPESGAAPEALYWEGVAAYKSSNDAGRLKDTARDLSRRYPESEWARRASVWAA